MFEYAAHAVALNEYRGALVAFPLESIMGAGIPEGHTRIELGFLGAHSDIGGGFPEQDLAMVALVWMVDQASAAGVKMGNPVRTIVSPRFCTTRAPIYWRGNQLLAARIA